MMLTMIDVATGGTGGRCDRSCTDSRLFADCDQVVRHEVCSNVNYARFCCHSCLRSRQLTMQQVKQVVLGPDGQGYRASEDGTKICFHQLT